MILAISCLNRLAGSSPLPRQEVPKGRFCAVKSFTNSSRTLIITDVQHDFMPGGALGVPGADAIVPIINALIPKFEHVLTVRDWHPPHHVSFASTHNKHSGDTIRIGDVEQILWPDHCVQNKRGSKFAEGLHRDRVEAEFLKGSDPEVDSYSAFFDSARHRSTGLGDHLRKHKLTHLYFVGVATDYCILYSVLDAIELGFDVAVILDACRPINRKPEDAQRAVDQMRAKEAKILMSAEFLKIR